MIYTGNVFGMGRIKNIPNKFARGQDINHKHPKFWDYPQFVLKNFIIPPPPKFSRSATGKN